jgi:valyl-tRNA synthetase
MTTNDFSPEALPNRFDHAEAQPRLFAAWEKGGFFHADPKKPGKPYSIVIPPPNVTGALHLGHALNNTLQDIQIRMKRMQGRNALWMPGTDHAGIATQAVVERRLKEDEGKSRHDLGREKLVERIWAWKDQYEARILNQLKRMGCSCDWERTRFTLDPICAKAVRQTFFDLFNKGLIYRGKRLVNWDTFLQTAVSDDEVFQEKVKGKFWHFRYPVVKPKAGEPSHVEIATTRPETMLGDTAVAVHPEPAKALDRAESELRERLAKVAGKDRAPIEEQLENIATRRKEMLPHLELLAKMARDGRKLMLPLANREIPLIADEWAKPEMGSGCVKITPAHDPNDYQVGIRCKLPMINILKEDGTITTLREPDGTTNNHATKYVGLTINKARARVVEDLEALGLLGDIEDREIELPHSDRSKTPIEPFLADQWFVKMSDHEGKAGLAQMAIDAVTSGRVKIFPERYTSSYVDWLAEKRDWPVSRQLWWGHQIPVWVGKFRTLPDALVKPLASIAKQSGQASVQILDDEFELEGDVVSGKRVLVCLGPDADSLAPELEKHGLVREPDVLDTWFSSALWPHSTLGWPEKTPELAAFYPTSVLITSRDIITLWVARMVLTGLNNMGDVPFREVFIHPKILDRYGDTMSKSKGNGVDPIDIIDKFGADALRFGLAQLTTETQDVRMPVQFECPHCEGLTDQTRENRTQPKITCSKCSKAFSTQWAEKADDKALPKGHVVSERFEVSRNFTNKLWNAARFALINLEGYTPANVEEASLTVEDKWILSRLATVTQTVTEAFDHYHYAEASKALYDFAWDEFCSFYVEMAKPRLQDATTRPHAQRILAHTLDVLLRLLHPVMPFVTEEMWALLGKMAPSRGLVPAAANPNLILAPWPQADAARQDATIETRFGRFQEVLAALREIRSRQNITGRQSLDFSIKCDDETTTLLTPMSPYFASMANAQAKEWGPSVKPSPTSASMALRGIEVFVDLKDFIDVDAEIEKNKQLEQKLLGLIKGKESKLSNESFVSRAPANVVQAERDGLADYQRQLNGVRDALVALRGQKG